MRDDEEQAAWRAHLIEAGLRPADVLDLARIYECDVDFNTEVHPFFASSSDWNEPSWSANSTSLPPSPFAGILGAAGAGVTACVPGARAASAPLDFSTAGKA
jgi:hypothetical protein